MASNWLRATFWCVMLTPLASLRLNDQVQKSQAEVTQLERIMFPNKRDVLEYRKQCGSDWHQLFENWESRQRGALRKDATVKIVVWRCRHFCGGLGDRQRGILTSFALALVTNRAFFIDSENPVPLQHYFHVADPELHWTFDNDLLEGRTHMEEDFLNSFPSIGDFATANLTYYEDFDVVIQINNFWRPLGILHNSALSSTLVHLLNSYEDYVLAGCILNYLLVPARDIQVQVDNSRNQALSTNENVLALQVRTGDSQSKDQAVLQEVVQYFDDCVDNIIKTSQSSFRSFLTTDSAEVARKFETILPNMFVFGGDITHIDGAFGSTDSPAAAFRKVILDHVMISQADVLIISRSGFGEMAALRGFKPYYTPLQCTYGKPVPHYSFPTKEPQGVPATDIHRIEEVFSNFESPLALHEHGVA